MRPFVALFALAGWLAQSVLAADTPKPPSLTKAQSGRIANVVAALLERLHFRQVPITDGISENFLKKYLNTLDYNHMVFLQSDCDEFTERYSHSLDDATLSGDATPGFRIYERYLQRLKERTDFAQKIVQQAPDFRGDEYFLPNRNKAPWPKDLAEAEDLWRARVKFDLLQGQLAKEKPEETVKTLSRRYMRTEKTMREFDNEEILELYLSSLTHVFDPHSDYMSPREAADFSIQNIHLKLTGIGAQLEWDDGYTKIRMLIPGGPAEISKLLKPGDRIVAVAQAKSEPVDTIEMPLRKVVSMIRGEPGTEVRLTIIPAKSPDSSTKKVISLIRDEINLKDQFAKARIVEETDPSGTVHRLGVINLPQFYENCSDHVEKLIGRLKKENITGMVLDLRHNGGGILDEAVALTGLFIKKGPVVQVKAFNKKTQILKDDDSKVAYDGPLIVLAGKLSASASEIVAAALQDYGRAVIVGDQATHGKGTVQTVQNLGQFMSSESVPDPGQLKVTVSKFYRIAGGTTQKQGVTPDIILPSIYDYLELGEASLENCLPADHIQPAEYTRVERVKPFLAELQRRSKERVSNSRDFSYILEDIEDVKKSQADKRVSLNEAKRLAEKDQAKEKVEARKKERASRHTPPEKAYEVTIEMVDKNQPLSLVSAKEKAEEAAAAAAAAADVQAGEAATVETDPPVDAQLNETLRILADYVAALFQA